MKDVNYPLRKAYKASLNGLTANGNPVEVYYNQLPEGDEDAAYILMVSPSSVLKGTFSTHDTDTSLQLQIRTWSENGNAGKIADDIADDIFSAIYPTPQSVLDLSADGLQMVGMRLQNDIVNTITGHGNREFVTRILTFTHNIYYK